MWVVRRSFTCGSFELQVVYVRVVRSVGRSQCSSLRCGSFGMQVVRSTGRSGIARILLGSRTPPAPPHSRRWSLSLVKICFQSLSPGPQGSSKAVSLVGSLIGDVDSAPEVAEVQGPKEQEENHDKQNVHEQNHLFRIGFSNALAQRELSHLVYRQACNEGNMATACVCRVCLRTPPMVRQAGNSLQSQACWLVNLIPRPRFCLQCLGTGSADTKSQLAFSPDFLHVWEELSCPRSDSLPLNGFGDYAKQLSPGRLDFGIVPLKRPAQHPWASAVRHRPPAGRRAAGQVMLPPNQLPVTLQHSPRAPRLLPRSWPRRYHSASSL